MVKSYGLITMGLQQRIAIHCLGVREEDLMTRHSMNLFDFGLPNIEVYSDGVVYDLYRKRVIGMPPKRTVTCRSIDDSVIRKFNIDRLVRMCFCNPWYYGERSVNLKFIGCSGYYAVDKGYIYSERIQAPLVPHYTRDGYQLVNLYTDFGDYQPWRVHRLIALAFLPNPDNKDTVNHIDGVRDHNNVNNLEWMWMWENKVHARTELKSGPTDETIRRVCELLEKGYKQMQVVRMLDVPRHLVKDIQYGSHYRITKDYKIPRYSNQTRAPIEFTMNKIGNHGQQNRTHKIGDDSDVSND